MEFTFKGNTYTAKENNYLIKPKLNLLYSLCIASIEEFTGHIDQSCKQKYETAEYFDRLEAVKNLEGLGDKIDKKQAKQLKDLKSKIADTEKLMNEDAEVKAMNKKLTVGFALAIDSVCYDKKVLNIVPYLLQGEKEIEIKDLEEKETINFLRNVVTFFFNLSVQNMNKFLN